MKRIFITGASAGIGLSIVNALLLRGDEVWGTTRDPGHVAQLQKLHPVILDLSDPASIEAGFKGALAEAGHFDVLINNAGSGLFGPAEYLSEQEITDQYQVLLFGPLQLMHLAMASMRAQGGGLIINVTSLASRLPVPYMAAYNSAKAAFASFVMSMQLELPDRKVRVVDVQPGDINTGFNKSVRHGRVDAFYRDRVAQTWLASEENMKKAPPADLVARQICRLIEQSRPPARISVGDFFQTKIAPFIFRFLPQSLRIWGLRKYYGI